MMGFGFIFLIVVVGFALWAASRPGNTVRATPPESARGILDARLARGELTVDEYRKLRGELGAAP